MSSNFDFVYVPTTDPAQAVAAAPSLLESGTFPIFVYVNQCGEENGCSHEEGAWLEEMLDNLKMPSGASLTIDFGDTDENGQMVGPVVPLQIFDYYQTGIEGLNLHPIFAPVDAAVSEVGRRPFANKIIWPSSIPDDETRMDVFVGRDDDANDTGLGIEILEDPTVDRMTSLIKIVEMMAADEARANQGAPTQFFAEGYNPFGESCILTDAEIEYLDRPEIDAFGTHTDDVGSLVDEDETPAWNNNGYDVRQPGPSDFAGSSYSGYGQPAYQ